MPAAVTRLKLVSPHGHDGTFLIVPLGKRFIVSLESTLKRWKTHVYCLAVVLLNLVECILHALLARDITAISHCLDLSGFCLSVSHYKSCELSQTFKTLDSLLTKPLLEILCCSFSILLMQIDNGNGRGAATGLHHGQHLHDITEAGLDRRLTFRQMSSPSCCPVPLRLR